MARPTLRPETLTRDELLALCETYHPIDGLTLCADTAAYAVCWDGSAYAEERCLCCHTCKTLWTGGVPADAVYTIEWTYAEDGVPVVAATYWLVCGGTCPPLRAAVEADRAQHPERRAIDAPTQG